MFLLDISPLHGEPAAAARAADVRRQDRRTDFTSELSRAVRAQSTPPAQNIISLFITSFINPLLVGLRRERDNLFQLAVTHRDELPLELRDAINTTVRPLTTNSHYSRLVGMLALFGRAPEVTERLRRELRGFLASNNTTRVQA